MKISILMFVQIVLFIGFLNAQDIDPKVTELWEPVPPVVTPGNHGNAPSDALILFDGTSLNKWESQDGGKAAWSVQGDAMTVEPGTGAIKSKDVFGSVQLHVEWKTPGEVKGDGQGRGNSGIFLMGRYELQVLDSYDNETYPNGQAASIYKQHIPLVNACKKPGEWQTYDIIFTAPVFGETGRVIHPARITVLHNGVLVQNNVTIWGSTTFRGLPQYSEHGKGPIVLQDHSNPVSYRNIWVREL
jgi:hypothetical protein